MPDVPRWDHNAYYHRWLLAQLPARCDRVLDVGSGTGQFAARLAARAGAVDALDRSREMVRVARTRVPANVCCVEADVLDGPLPGADYDAVTCISVLHHMPLEPALRVLGAAVRPGGVLAAVGLYRTRWTAPADLAAEVRAVVAQQFYAAAFAAGRRLRPGAAFFAHDPANFQMPMLDATVTLAEIRAGAAAVLPGAEVRRRVFWRYSLLWRRPLDA